MLVPSILKPMFTSTQRDLIDTNALLPSQKGKISWLRRRQRKLVLAATLLLAGNLITTPAYAAQTIDDTPSATSCSVQGGVLSGINLFTPFDNGTMGVENGDPDQSPATDPYPAPDPYPDPIPDPPPDGIRGGDYRQYNSGTAPLKNPTYGQYSYVANLQNPRNTSQHEDITDPVYGDTGRFFVSDPDNDTPILTATLTGLTPNQFYEYSFWAANAEPNGNSNNLDVFIDRELDPIDTNAVPVYTTGPLPAVPAALAWKKHTFTFTNGPNTSITVELASTETGNSGNDFNLDNIELQECNFAIDYGDAPSSYGEVLHTTIPVTPTVYLGTTSPDSESTTPTGGDAGAGADGDDNTGDDEDAFTTLPNISTTGTYDLTNIPVNNTSGVDATLHAWIDFDKDGKFSTSEYQSATVPDGVSTRSLSWTIPSGVTTGDTYARFRITQNELLPDDAATTDVDERSKNAVINGEVEDYPVVIDTGTPISLDYGDAPDTYGTDATDDSGEGIGARHSIVNNLYIGLPPDAETDAATPLDGTGDGTDEDGVTVRAMTAGATSFLVSRDEISVTNDTGSDATLHGWIDFNKDGVFSATEHTSIVIPNGSIGVTPSADLVWNSITVGASGSTYARFRLTTDSSITDSTPGGTASDGEVEDYEVAIAPAPPTQSGGACSIPYSMVYSGHFPNRIDAIHVDSGAFVALTTSTLAGNTNSLASDHINNLVYYAENNSLYAWSPITNTHTTISSNFGGFIGGAIDLGSGGAAFYNGSLYIGTDVDGINPSEVYRVDFVPSSNGLTVQSVTSLNLAGIIPTTDWGDLTIDENGLLLASGGGGVFWTYDLFNSTFTTLSSTVPGDQHQFAKDGMGRLWAIVYTPTMFVVQVEVTGSTIQPVGSTISVAPHDTNDGAECVIGESSIGDRIWADADGDGVQDPGESGIENVTVDLYWDIDGDGQIDPGDDPVLATQTTGASGNYDFFDLIFGDYIIQVTDTNNVLTDYTLTTLDSEYEVTLAAGVVDFNDADFGYQPPTIATDPNILLVKRMTAINRGGANEQLFDTSYVNSGTANDADNETNWPGGTEIAANGGTVESYINGITNGTDSGVTIHPGDEIEYTISFLSNGDVAAQDVLICDRIPTHTTFLTTAFNSSPPATPGPGDRGIFITFNGSAVALTNVNDGDEIPDTGSDDGVGGYYFPPGVEPTTVFPDLTCNGTNTNGAIVVDVSSIPRATGDGTPTNAYGFIRFRAVVD